MSATMSITNEAFRLKLTYAAENPPALTEVCAARRDSSSFQMIINSDSFYCLSVGLHDWYSSRNKQDMIGSPIRLRAAVEAPFPVTLNIEEFVTDDDDISIFHQLHHFACRIGKQNIDRLFGRDVQTFADK